MVVRRLLVVLALLALAIALVSCVGYALTQPSRVSYSVVGSDPAL